MASNCKECGKPLIGRIDKKFCNDQCRFQYNNKKKRVHESAILNINQQLRKNRTIHRTEKGLTYYFNYDYGYMLIEDEKIVLVTYQRYMDKRIYDLLKERKY